MAIIKSDRDRRYFAYSAIPLIWGSLLSLNLEGNSAISFYSLPISLCTFILLFVYGMIRVYRSGSEILRENLRNYLWAMLILFGGITILGFILKFVL